MRMRACCGGSCAKAPLLVGGYVAHVVCHAHETHRGCRIILLKRNCLRACLSLDRLLGWRTEIHPKIPLDNDQVASQTRPERIHDDVSDAWLVTDVLDTNKHVHRPVRVAVALPCNFPLLSGDDEC